VIRTVVTDDDPGVRRRIRAALEGTDILVVAEGHDGREAVELARHYRPDVLVLSATMRRLDGIAATRLIAETNPEQVIVLLTGGGEDELGVHGLMAGAAGCVRKDMDLACLPRVLHAVTAGEAAVSRRQMRSVIDRFRASPE
jgi:DNA-binding NarL/FixJ family response regulator